VSRDLPTIRELLDDASRALAEPFSRAALISWISARRPDVAVASIAHHIQLATANVPGREGVGPAPLLYRVERGRYRRYRLGLEESLPADEAHRVVLVGSSGALAASPRPAAEIFESEQFARARRHAVESGQPWFVLSARHGLLDPADVVDPFALLFGDQPADYRAAWAERVAGQLAERVRLSGAIVEVHGGVDFVQALRGPLARRGARTEIALPDTWDEPPVHDEADHEHRARAALGKLFALVSRH
jgi:hypothetical protein